MIQQFVAEVRDILDMLSVKLFALTLGGAVFTLFTPEQWKWLAAMATIFVGVTGGIMNCLRIVAWVIDQIIERRKKKKNGV